MKIQTYYTNIFIMLAGLEAEGGFMPGSIWRKDLLQFGTLG